MIYLYYCPERNEISEDERKCEKLLVRERHILWIFEGGHTELSEETIRTVYFIGDL